MTILFLHGWQSVPGGVKPTCLARHGRAVINPTPVDEFGEAARDARTELDKHEGRRITASWSRRIAWATLSVGTIVLCGANVARSEEPSPQDRGTLKVVGYLPFYRMATFDQAQAKFLTDLIYFSVQPNEKGDLDDHEVTKDALDRLLRMKGDYGARIQIAVGGWGRSDAFGSVCTNAEKRQRFVRGLLKFCLDKKLDGVDFDWEFPSDEQENKAYSLLLIETKAAFRPHGLLVTVALNSSQELAAEAYNAVDRIHIMSYDHEGKEHSTLKQAQGDLENFLARRIPKEKLFLGMPFYGRKPGGDPDALSYADIVHRFRPAKVKDSAGDYYFNGIETIRKKTRYAIDQGISGVMIWEVGQDTNDKTSLLRAVKEIVSKR